MAILTQIFFEISLIRIDSKRLFRPIHVQRSPKSTVYGLLLTRLYLSQAVLEFNELNEAKRSRGTHSTVFIIVTPLLEQLMYPILNIIYSF